MNQENKAKNWSSKLLSGFVLALDFLTGLVEVFWYSVGLALLVLMPAYILFRIVMVLL